MKNIAITGAGVRMGKALIEAIASNHGIQLTVAIEYSGSPLIGCPLYTFPSPRNRTRIRMPSFA